MFFSFSLVRSKEPRKYTAPLLFPSIGPRQEQKQKQKQKKKIMECGNYSMKKRLSITQQEQVHVEQKVFEIFKILDGVSPHTQSLM